MVDKPTGLKIGVISDTHGLLRPEAIDALQGVDDIIHAGDIGKQPIIETLADIAPLHVISGNIDTADWASDYPQTLSLSLAGKSIYVLHDVNAIAVDPVDAGIDIVISGHSHKPALTEQGGVLYLNPGSAGPRRFKLPVTIAMINIIEAKISAEIVPLQLAQT